MAKSALSELERHEAECAVRYQFVQDKLEGLDKRMWRMEALILATSGTIITLLVSFLWGS